MRQPDVVVDRAVGHLRFALDLLKSAGAFKAIERVRAALRAAELDKRRAGKTRREIRRRIKSR